MQVCIMLSDPSCLVDVPRGIYSVIFVPSCLECLMQSLVSALIPSVTIS